MKSAVENGGLVKISAFVFVSVALFYFGKQWSDEDRQLLFFNYGQFAASVTSQTPLVAVSPNHSKPFNVTALIDDINQTASLVPNEEVVAAVSPDITSSPLMSLSSPPSSSPPPVASDNISSTHQPPPPSPAPPLVERFGIVDENGTMSDEFGVGDFDSEIVEILRNVNQDVEGRVDDGGTWVGVVRFPQCSTSMTNYIPCLDATDAVKLKSTTRGQRHCPEKGKGLNCLIPRPKGYKRPIPWPKSRDEVWYSNVPHTRLVEDKWGQNWISVAKNKFRSPGGGTQFSHGADQYIDQISKMVPDITFGQRTRVVLDVGCGIASFGAYLMSRNVLTLSVAPKDVHGNQIQFALERGVPAMVAAFATHRLMYPSQAFDLIHCSRCTVDWTRYGGILLLELNRMLRAGGYFVWAAQPVYKHEVNLEEKWKEMVDLTTRLCWELVKKEGYIAIWRKPLNNICYLSRQKGTRPSLCDTNDDPDNVWYVDLKACISRLPENGSGASVIYWPWRLNNPPDRLQTINIDAYISRKELYKAESRYGDEIVETYARVMHWKKLKFRNVMDMRAGFGGCEPFDAYPRTYDLLHASGLFSLEQSRCDVASIMLEMDRILRPGGFAYIHDSVTVIHKLQEIGNAMGWKVKLQDTSEGPHASYKLLKQKKTLKTRN